MRFIALTSLLLISPMSFALVIGQTQTFQMPAWIERGDQRIALGLGDDILAGDKIITGKQSRVLLNVRDGSDIKIGEASQFSFDKAEETTVFTGSFRLLSGAFRYATNPDREQIQRDLNLQVGAVSIGIRGTDVWGKSGQYNDTVVLIEGDVELKKDDGSTTRLNTPLTHVVTQKTLPLENPIPVVMDDLKAWAFETELQKGNGVISKQGQYRLHLGAFEKQADANNLINILAEKGYRTLLDTESNPEWIRVVIENFDSLDDAQSIAQQISVITNRSDYWFSK